ncbi:MAG: pre-peptidase C-terminal domain-containing protein [Planctomycetes bacterium]|nr:pre-peptidase C-terminal domain-containing protein [Planctomycetota bacterium]
MIMAVRPVAVQAGKTCECEFESRYNLHGAYRVFISGTGVAGEVDPPPALKPGATRPEVSRLKVRFKTAADARPGMRDVRLVTPQGASTLGQLVIVRDPIVVEAPNNNTMKTAQAITLPAAVCGALEAQEDVDFFKFRVAAGQALTFHMYCHRLADRIHDLQSIADPILILRDDKGTVLASNDNYYAADPLLHHKFDKAGEYYLEVRDVRFAGEPHWTYCIEINDRPYVTHVHPMRATPGATTKLHLSGHSLPPDATADLTLPAQEAEGLRWYTLPLSKGEKSNPVPVVVSNLPDVREAPGDNDTPVKAQLLRVPAGVSGRMDAPGDVDCYAVDAKKGERFTFEVIAQRHGSHLDSLLRILGPKGERLAENDDHQERNSSYNGFNQYADSFLDWEAPADGRYVVQVRDVHQRGGPAFGYFLQVTHTRPTFVMDTDTDKTLLAPGTAAVLHVRLTRKGGFSGEVQLGIEGLAPGVKASCGRILANGTDGCIILQATADAAQGASNVRITGTANVPGTDGKPVALTVEARPLQEFYNPGGGRNHFPVQMHTVSISEPLDLEWVKISPAAVTLKPGESKKVEVEVKRRPGFKANLTLDVIYQHLEFVYNNSLPPGVTVDGAGSQTLLTGEQSKGWIMLKAAADAKPVANQQVAVMVHASINFAIKFTYSSEPLRVTVTKP